MLHIWKKTDNLLIVTNQYKVTEEKLKRLNPEIKDWNCIDEGAEIIIK